MKILFVDDVYDTREFFRLALTLQGIEVQTSANGAEALLWMDKQSFDAMVVDVDMPVMNGWAVLLEVRKRPEFDRVAVLLWTAFHEPSLEVGAMAAGADYCMRKPIMPDEMVQYFNECIQKRHGKVQ